MKRAYSSLWLGLFPAVYLAHLIDERYFWIGTPDFATRYLGIYLTNAAWWAVNVPSLIFLTIAAVLTARGVFPQWAAIALAVHLALHGLGRVPTSLWTLKIAPGLLTGLLLCTPLAVATLWRARRTLAPKQFVWGVLAGVGSSQPLWHFAILPVSPMHHATPNNALQLTRRSALQSTFDSVCH